MLILACFWSIEDLLYMVFVWILVATCLYFCSQQKRLERKREGNLIWPLLIDNDTPDMRIAWKEPFRPVIPVIRIKTVEEGIHHCYTNNFALQGWVFIKDIIKAILVSDATKSGTIQINAAAARGPDNFPFQALRDSEIASQGITNSIQMMTKIKSTVINLPTEPNTMG
uniref:NADP-dependent glyceraldehyde-3-phosphate dehydrogenase n=1 Tax=Physcomitrium patens TaxID=3218 RepID=A0A2K1KVN5_PHYPA|nr:hypothetical protein PHYPA_004851 [Physcomitrium patens]